MEKHLKGLGVFLAYLIVTNLVVAPIVRKMTPKDAATGLPIINLL